MPTFSNALKETRERRMHAREQRSHVFAGELDAVVEEIHDLAPVHDIVSALGEGRLAGDDGLAADGSGASGGARLCALELVVVGSEVEGRGLQQRGHRGLRRHWVTRRRRGSAVAHRRVPKRDRKLELEFEFPLSLSLTSTNQFITIRALGFGPCSMGFGPAC